MLTVIQIDNPFDPFLKEAQRQEMFGAYTPLAVLERLYPGFTEFAHPTICLVNGQPWLRSQWHDEITPGSVITFVRLAQGVVEIIIAIVILIVAVVVSLVVVKGQNAAAIGADDATQRNGNPVYTLSGQQNQFKLNNAIECCYGRNRIYPAYAAIPYTVYQDNEQYQYSLFCLGHGPFEIDYNQVRFEDTPITQLNGITMEVYPPGASPTLIAARVSTSTTISNFEMLGHNEDGYKAPIPYDVCEPGAQTNKIEVDVSLPSGLYKVNTKNGDLEKEKINARFEYRLVDDTSAPLGDWITLFSFEKNEKTLNPKRYTLSATVTLGRYQIRGKRTDKKNKEAQSANVLRWESLRAFIPSTTDYGDVTLIGVKARATNQLNNNVGFRFNLIATRKLPVWSSDSGWSAPQVTRNPIWAFCDIFRASYGGRLSARFLDLPGLAIEANYFTVTSTTFDYIFDQRATVWEAAKTVAKVGRSLPMLNGSQITIVRDQPRATATAVFNQHNIVAGSFSWNIKLPSVAENDGIEIEYMDATTWVAETVLCLIDKDRGDNPEKVKLPGCSDRTKAFQEGLYMRATQLYQKEVIDFKTGLEGHLPAYGALIMVTHDVPRWGTGGIVKQLVNVGSTTVIFLSQPVTFVASFRHRIVLRRKNGGAYGPVACTEGETAYSVIVPLISEDFFFDDTHDAPYFLFGVENQETRRCLVVGITPEDNDTVSIRAIPYDERVFSFVSVATPAKYALVVAPRPASGPTITGAINASFRGSPDFITFYWNPPLGAKYYRVEISEDGITYTLFAEPNYSTIVVPVAGFTTLYFRVAAHNVTFGPWNLWNGDVTAHLTPEDVENLHIFSVGSGRVKIAWDNALGASSYTIAVYQASNRNRLRFEETSLTSYEYTLAMGVADGLRGRTIFFRVRGRNLAADSEHPAEIYAVIPDREVPPQSTTPPIRVDRDTLTVDNVNFTLDQHE